MSDTRALIRVPAQEVVPGDRMGDGRWQGLQIVDVKYPVFERMAIGGIDPEIVRISLGNHGWIGCRKDELVLVERAPVPAAEGAQTQEQVGAVICSTCLGRGTSNTGITCPTCHNAPPQTQEGTP